MTWTYTGFDCKNRIGKFKYYSEEVFLENQENYLINGIVSQTLSGRTVFNKKHWLSFSLKRMVL